MLRHPQFAHPFPQTIDRHSLRGTRGRYMLHIRDVTRPGVRRTIEKCLLMRYAGVGIERRLACDHDDRLCSFALLRKCRLHLRAQKSHRLSLHCFRVGPDMVLIQRSGCNRDKRTNTDTKQVLQH